MNIGLNSTLPTPQNATYEQNTANQRTVSNCKICSVRKIDGVAYAPCGDMATCEPCRSERKNQNLAERCPECSKPVLCYVNKFSIPELHEAVESNSTTQPATTQTQQQIQAMATPNTAPSNTTLQNHPPASTTSTAQADINYNECMTVLNDLQIRAEQIIDPHQVHHVGMNANKPSVMMPYATPSSAIFSEGPAKLNWNKEFIDKKSESVTSEDYTYMAEANEVNVFFNQLSKFAKKSDIDNQLKAVACNYTIKLFNQIYNSLNETFKSKAFAFSANFLRAAESTISEKKLQNKEQKLVQLFEAITGGNIKDPIQLRRFGNPSRGNEDRPKLIPLPCTREKGWEIFLRDFYIDETNIGTAWWFDSIKHTEPGRYNFIINNNKGSYGQVNYLGEVPE